MTDVPSATPPQEDAVSGVGRPRGVLGALSEQVGWRELVMNYLTPVEVNNFWYGLGGVLAISLALEVFTGMLLSIKYTPDAGSAYDITKHLLSVQPWSTILNFHYWASFLIFGLVLIHMMRVFISGGYRRGKQTLWLIGAVLAMLTFLISLTGESLHWDEVGYGVPWNISEALDAVGLAGRFNYTIEAIKQIPIATQKLSQLYAVHIAIVPIILMLFIGMHYFLIRVKGISLPFWLRASGRVTSFSEHVRVWLVYSGVILGVVLLVSIFVQRDAGTAPQLMPTSPIYNSDDDPGGLGFRPNYPISWTRGMNVVVANVGVDPDIWGSIGGMIVLFGSLLLVPFVDPGPKEPDSTAAAFNLRKRGLAFALIIIFWVVMLVGTIASAVTGAG